MVNKIKKLEQKHLDLILKKIKKRIKQIIIRINKSKKNIQETEKGWKDIQIKTSDYNALIETGASVHAQQQMLQQKEQDKFQLSNQFKTLKKLKNRPYFARIDFIDSSNHSKKIETIYIGLSSFADKNGNFYIYDWRAPISSIYYEGELGKINYQTPVGKQVADVKLKRQFEISNGKISAVFDTKEAVGDKLLIDALSNDSSTKMKSIVTTIQKDQNKIIRDTNSDLLFVQGPAGSGKTATILQRIAYLLYHYRGKIASWQIILFSPNQIFNDYIKEVLPDLGENNMIQMTFYQYANYRLPKIKIQTLTERFKSTNNKLLIKINDLKGSLKSVSAANQYSKLLSKKGMSFRNLSFQKKIIFTKEEISTIYYSFNDYYSLSQRINSTKEQLIKKIYRKIPSEMKKRWVDITIENLTGSQIESLLGNSDTNQFENEDKNYNRLARMVVIKAFKPLISRIKRGSFINPNKTFLGFLKTFPKLIKLSNFMISKVEWEKSFQQTKLNLKNHQLGLTDTTIYLYLFDLINGHHGDNSIRFLFIDEIQDYTPFQLAFLHHIFPKARFTLLGDLNQAIFTQKEANQLEKDTLKIFPSKKTKIIHLNKTYRSTKQITKFTNNLLGSSQSKYIEPFSRNGKKPNLILGNSYKNLKKTLNINNNENLRTAIITKNVQQTKKLYHQLNKDKYSTTAITLENQRLVPGTTIIPSYLSKGLEFDAVIIWQADDKNYPTKSDRDLLYTITSRAMHKLTILAEKKFCPLLKNINSGLYDKE